MMLDIIFQMLQEKRKPRILHISYRWERALRQEMQEYRGLLPIVTPLSVFGMWIHIEYVYGPWAWIEEAWCKRSAPAAGRSTPGGRAARADTHAA